MEKRFFAAFIITYERTQTLLETIEKIKRQTLPPEKILIVDNSVTDDTFRSITALNDLSLDYHRVGYNSGPAGGAAIGLAYLANEGYEWIFWGDDNDPPRSQDAFKELIQIAKQSTRRVGLVCAYGNNFNRYTGVISTIPTEEIVDEMYVNNTAGGSCIIANAKAITEAGVPNNKLFFGFEDLDFCLKLNRKNYEILVSGRLFRQFRLERSDTKARKKRMVYRDVRTLWREYYSIRNLLYLFLFEYRLYTAALLTFIRFQLKVVFSLRLGFGYFFAYCSIFYRACWHALSAKLGLTIRP
jgi:GT2 family glycosyltransferase